MRPFGGPLPPRGFTCPHVSPHAPRLILLNVYVMVVGPRPSGRLFSITRTSALSTFVRASIINIRQNERSASPYDGSPSPFYSHRCYFQQRSQRRLDKHIKLADLQRVQYWRPQICKQRSLSFISVVNAFQPFLDDPEQRLRLETGRPDTALPTSSRACSTARAVDHRSRQAPTPEKKRWMVLGY